MTVPFWRRQKQTLVDGPNDVVILGGGFIGLSTAYWLNQHQPNLKITVLESSYCGAGASGRNAGFITKGSANFYRTLAATWGKDQSLAIHHYINESIKLLHDHILLNSTEVDYVPTISRTLFKDEQSKNSWLEGDILPEDIGIEWLEAQKLGNKLSTKFFGAFESKYNEYAINPRHLIEQLQRLLLKTNVNIIEDTSAYDICSEGIKTDTKVYKTKNVILALNGYSGQFHVNFRSSIFPRRAQMLAVKLKEDLNLPGLYYDSPQRVYWRKGQDKVLIIGGKRLLDEVEEKSDFDKISSVIQEGLEKYIREDLGLEFDVINRWSGIMGFTDQELPIVTHVKSELNTYVVAGFSGHGIGLGFKASKDVADMMLNNKKTSFFDQFKKAEISL